MRGLRRFLALLVLKNDFFRRVGNELLVAELDIDLLDFAFKAREFLAEALALPLSRSIMSAMGRIKVASSKTV